MLRRTEAVLFGVDDVKSCLVMKDKSDAQAAVRDPRRNRVDAVDWSRTTEPKSG